MISGTLRARLMDTPANAELAAIKRFCSAAQSVASRLRWQSAMQRRTTNFASILRMMRRLVPCGSATRRKVPGAWLLEVQRTDGPSLVLTVVTRNPARTVADLEVPIVTLVHRRDLVNLTVLEQLQARGLIQIVAPP